MTSMALIEKALAWVAEDPTNRAADIKCDSRNSSSFCVDETMTSIWLYDYSIMSGQHLTDEIPDLAAYKRELLMAELAKLEGKAA